MLLNKRTKSSQKSRKGRRLAVEHLENRTLLSASAGLSAFFGPHGWGGYYGSWGYGSTSSTTAVDYSMSLPSKVLSGTIVSVKITALSANGRTATGYTGTGTSGAGVANLASSNGAQFYATATSTTPMTTPTVDFTNGVATIYVKFVNAGSQTITATDSATSSITGSAGTFVQTPDSVASFGATLPASVYAGAKTTVHAVAYDANGFVDTQYSGTADLTTTASGVTFSTTAVQFHNGYATFQVTYATPGTSEPITLTDSAISTATDTFSTNVVADVAAGYVINLPSKAIAGQPVNVQVSAVDANGNLVNSYSGTATVAITGSSTSSQNITFTNGKASFSVTFASSAVGTQGTVTVTDKATTSPLPTAEAFTSIVPQGRGGWGNGGGGGSGSSGSTGSTGSSGSSGSSGSTGSTGSSGSGATAASNASTSTNWSGYAVQASNGSVTAVSGTWTVPSVTGSGGYSAIWVGIDGYQSSTVEQIGTEQDTSGDGDYAWYEMYPGASQTITTLAISAGDSITGSVTYSGSSFTLTLTDNTTGKSFTTQQSGSNLQRSSAEWIVEAPWSGGVLPLANFNTVTFTNASATIGGKTGAINGSAWTPIAINMASSFGATEATTSVLNSTGNGFSVTYNSSGSSSSGNGFGFGFSGFGFGFGFGGLGFTVNTLAQNSQAPAANQQAALDYLFGSGVDFLRL
jgi:hypothetical protein